MFQRFGSETVEIVAAGVAMSSARGLKRDRLLVEAADALHDATDLDEGLWLRPARLFSPEHLLDLLMLAGWYHAVSFTANAARVACEDWTPRFADVLSMPSR